jgi:hypothetical protein
MRTTVFLTVTPTFRRRYSGGEWENVPHELRVTKLTQKRPSGPGVVVKLTLDIPAAAFMPLRPEAIVEVDLDDAQTIVSVEVEPPEEEG